MDSSVRLASWPTAINRGDQLVSNKLILGFTKAIWQLIRSARNNGWNNSIDIK
jgi:hypothetical protein